MVLSSPRRGATENPAGRFERLHYDEAAEFAQPPAPDEAGPAGPRRTAFFRDPSRRALSWNQSPDLPFDASLNPYRLRHRIGIAGKLAGDGALAVRTAAAGGRGGGRGARRRDRGGGALGRAARLRVGELPQPRAAGRDRDRGGVAARAGADRGAAGPLGREGIRRRVRGRQGGPGRVRPQHRPGDGARQAQGLPGRVGPVRLGQHGLRPAHRRPDHRLQGPARPSQAGLDLSGPQVRGRAGGTRGCRSCTTTRSIASWGTGWRACGRAPSSRSGAPTTATTRWIRVSPGGRRSSDVSSSWR